MKKTCLSLLLFFAVSLLYAKESFTIIKGSISGENVLSVSLFEVIEGKKVEFASSKVTNGSFAFALPVLKEGYYYISDQRKAAYTRIYLKPKDQLELDIDAKGYKVIKGSKENKLMQEWFATAFVVIDPAMNWQKDTFTYRSYFPKMEAFMPGFDAFKKKIKTGNPRFDELFRFTVDMDIEHAAMKFLLTPHSVHPTKEQYPAIYHSIVQPKKYPSTAILQLGDAVDILKLYITFQFLMNRTETKPASRLLANCDMFANDTVKGAFVASSLNFRTYELLEKEIAPVKKYLLTDSMKATYFRALKALATFKRGSAAYNFVLEDINAKKVSMNDLKGKVVFVDVWATWCRPCLAEIPYLKQMEETFKGKNIEFVSISVDVEKDKEKWKNMVTKDQLGGTQLFANGMTEFAEFYNINGIPRFMVFDQQGKIVTVDAPRPSSPEELKELLQNTLDGK